MRRESGKVPTLANTPDRVPQQVVLGNPEFKDGKVLEHGVVLENREFKDGKVL